MRLGAFYHCVGCPSQRPSPRSVGANRFPPGGGAVSATAPPAPPASVPSSPRPPGDGRCVSGAHGPRDVLRRVMHMEFIIDYLLVFWQLPWSAPLRAALPWQPEWLPTLAEPPVAPNWLRPLCVQRWVGQAVAARLAWLQRQPEPDAIPPRFGSESFPEWHPFHLGTYGWRELHALSAASLRWLLGMEVERLCRLARTPPGEIGVSGWVAACLAVCLHVAQLYHELRRRYRTRRARQIVREELAAFLAWGVAEAEAAAARHAVLQAAPQ